MRLCVLDFASPADAFAAAMDGDAIYFPSVDASNWPAPDFYTAPPGGWIVDKAMTIYGDGAGHFDSDVSAAPSGSVLRPSGNDDPVLRILAPISGVVIRDLRFYHFNIIPGGAGSAISQPLAGPTTDIIVQRVIVSGFGGNGIEILSNTEDGLDRIVISESVIHGCGVSGINVKYCHNVHIVGVHILNNAYSGVEAELCELGLYESTIEHNNLGTYGGALHAPGDVHVKSCPVSRVQACRFTNCDQGAKTGIYIDGGMPTIGWCRFASDELASGSVGIRVAGTAGPVLLLSNSFAKTETIVQVGSDTKDCWIMPQYDESGDGVISLPALAGSGLLGVPGIVRGSGSLSSGMLVPAGTSNPTEGVRDGMFAYNTSTKKLMARVSGAWRTVQTE